VRALGHFSVPPGRPLETEAGVQEHTVEAACAARDWAFTGAVREAEPVNGKRHQRPG
jgi:hypothetical protein